MLSELCMSSLTLSCEKTASGMSPKYFLSLVILLCLVSVILATNSQKCGIIETELAGPGSVTAAGKWPWLVALFQIKSIRIYKFFCVGSLISAKHVLSGKVANRENIA